MSLPGEAYKLTPKSKRCYHRVMSGLTRGGSLRFLTLTSSNEAPEDIQKSWRALYMRLQRRHLIEGYIKVPETVDDGRTHLHILFRGPFVAQCLIKSMWEDIHQSSIVDIRLVRPHGKKTRIASYMAKYMCKEMAGRYSWNWTWVWKGFVRDWKLWKRYWNQFYNPDGNAPFRRCISGWNFFLMGILEFDREDMLLSLHDDIPP